MRGRPQADPEGMAACGRLCANAMFVVPGDLPSSSERNRLRLGLNLFSLLKLLLNLLLHAGEFDAADALTTDV